MPGYARKASYREDTPDRPIVGMAVIDVPILPDAFQTEEQQQLFENELDMIADWIGLYIGNEEDFEAKSSVREGVWQLTLSLPQNSVSFYLRPTLSAQVS